jgi:hypothetical protein
MSSNNYGVVVEGVDIPAAAWLKKWDWSRKYHVLTIGDKTGIPDLMTVEMAELVPGETVRELISRCEPEHMEAINRGNGHHGLCLYDTQALHYVVSKTEY